MSLKLFYAFNVIHLEHEFGFVFDYSVERVYFSPMRKESGGKVSFGDEFLGIE